MKHLLDVSAVQALLKGDPVMRVVLRSLAREDVGLPLPVVAHVSARLASVDRTTWPGLLVHARWDRARELFPRCPWTEEVCARLAELRAAHPRALELDREVAAHALAHGASVLIGAEAAGARLSAFSGVRVERWGRAAAHGRYPDSP